MSRTVYLTEGQIDNLEDIAETLALLDFQGSAGLLLDMIEEVPDGE